MISVYRSSTWCALCSIDRARAEGREKAPIGVRDPVSGELRELHVCGEHFEELRRTIPERPADFQSFPLWRLEAKGDPR